MKQAPACPDPEAAVPGFPNAQPIPGASMATSINPGLNSSRAVYALANPTTEVVALYDRCFGSSTTGVYPLPSRQGTRSIAVAQLDAATNRPERTQVTVACERCY